MRKFCLAFVMCFLAAAAAADAVLSVTGQSGRTHRFSAADLAALPQVTIVTGTEFTDAAAVYEGPLARTVLSGLRDGATEARMIAANDYEVVIPLSDFDRYDVVMALKQDGQTLSRRDKGPIWVMYPMDANPELRGPLYDNRLIWQLVAVRLR